MTCATPITRVRPGRLESSPIRLCHNFGPVFQALASFLGFTIAMTPSPIKTIAAKCFARFGSFRNNIVSKSVPASWPLPAVANRSRYFIEGCDLRPRYNYDSFTYNLVQYMGELGAEVVVRRNDELTPGEVVALKPERILLCSGPARRRTPASSSL